MKGPLKSYTYSAHKTFGPSWSLSNNFPSQDWILGQSPSTNQHSKNHRTFFQKRLLDIGYLDIGILIRRIDCSVWMARFCKTNGEFTPETWWVESWKTTLSFWEGLCSAFCVIFREGRWSVERLLLGMFGPENWGPRTIANLWPTYVQLEGVWAIAQSLTIYTILQTSKRRFKKFAFWGLSKYGCFQK